MTSRCLKTPVGVLLLLASAVSAQVPGTTETVTIVAASPLPGLDLTRDQVAAPIQRGNVSDANEQNLAEWMNRNLGGVMVQELQGNPFQADVQYRGFTASPLLGTPQGLSVYLDGMRMNQPFGDALSWDLIPRAALKSVTLMPGSNPLFGLNTLGGALALETKDGRSHPGTQMQVQAGSHQRRSVLLEHGWVNDTGWDGYVMAQVLHDGGWRAQSPSEVRQFFGKLGWRDGRTRSHLSISGSDNDLQGNGLQEGGQLARDGRSVYTTPDITRQHALMLNWTGSHEVRDGWTLSAQAYMRTQKGSTLNGDVNEASLDQNIYYKPTAANALLLADHGYSGYPTVQETGANTAFPYWSCLAHALLPNGDANKEPAEKCTGLLTRSETTQRNQGLVVQSSWQGQQGSARTQSLVGAALDTSRVRFTQSSQLGYVTADRSVVGVPAWGDGVTGGNVDGEAWDTAVDLQGRTQTRSVFGSQTWSWAGGWHFTTSGRYNETRVSNLDLRNDGQANSLSGEHRYARLNPAVGLTWAPSAQLQGWLGYNEGSRAPTTTELGCANPAQPCKLPNAMASDPPLQQVVTRTWELGMRGRLADQHRWSAGLFRAVNDQDILFVASEDEKGYGYFRNFGQTRRQGLELSLAGTLNAEWTYGMHYNWLQATYQSAETLAGNSNSSNNSGAGLEGTIAVRPGDSIPMTPRQMFKFQLGWKPSAAWRMNLDMQAVGRSIARGNENNAHQADGTYYSGAGYNPGFAVFNWSGQYTLQPGWTLTGQINNLFDTQYTTAAVLAPNAFNGNAISARSVGDVTDTDGHKIYKVRSGTFYAPGAPRSVGVGMKYIF